MAIGLIAGILAGALCGSLFVYLWARGEIGRRDDKLESVQRTDAEWQEHLKALTAEALSANSSGFLDLAKTTFKPISETLEKFEEQSRELEQKRLTAVGAIPQLVESLRKETGSLVTALRTPHIRGGWGEMQLKRVIELAGMLAHCDFLEQASERDGDGKLLRPDVVVKIPGGKSIVVDSKAPLEAFLDAAGADDEETRRTQLARHAKLVREHMTKLGQKRYWEQFQPTPEFVVMFVDEGLFRAALDQDPALFEAGVDAGVIIASPSTLIALLRTVAYCWQQETVAESARAVNKLGRELYDRLGKFGTHLAKVGRALDSSVGAYNEAVGSFETRVLVTARKFPEHGVGSDELPEVGQIDRQPKPVLAPELENEDGVFELPTRAA